MLETYCGEQQRYDDRQTNAQQGFIAGSWPASSGQNSARPAPNPARQRLNALAAIFA
jgi:hypothetical protein